MKLCFATATHNFEWVKITYECTNRIKIYVSLVNLILYSLSNFLFKGQMKGLKTIIAVITTDSSTESEFIYLCFTFRNDKLISMLNIDFVYF